MHRPQQPQRQQLAGPKSCPISLAGNPRPGGCLLFCLAVPCAACASTTGFHTALGLLPTQHSGSLTLLRRCLVSSRSYLLSGADWHEARLVPEMNIITQNGCLEWLYTRKSRGRWRAWDCRATMVLSMRYPQFRTLVVLGLSQHLSS